MLGALIVTLSILSSGSFEFLKASKLTFLIAYLAYVARLPRVVSSAAQALGNITLVLFFVQYTVSENSIRSLRPISHSHSVSR